MQIVRLGIIGAILIMILGFVYYRQVFLPQEKESRVQQQKVEDAIRQY